MQFISECSRSAGTNLSGLPAPFEQAAPGEVLIDQFENVEHQ